MSPRRVASGRGVLPPRGFTLVEIVAVLAILAILAGTIAPSISRSLRDARLDSERATLQSIAGLIREQVRRNGNIPSSASWAASLSAFSDVGAARLQQNPDGWSRGYVVDPAWAPASTRQVGAGGWTQTPAAAELVTSAPTSARILLFSDLLGDAQVACQNMTAAQFSAVWDATAAAPAGCTDAASRVVARVNLSGEFVAVTRNLSAPFGPPAPGWTLSGNLLQTQSFAAAGSATRWFLRGSRLGLVAGGAVVAEVVVAAPVSLTWNGSAWSGY